MWRHPPTRSYRKPVPDAAAALQLPGLCTLKTAAHWSSWQPHWGKRSSYRSKNMNYLRQTAGLGRSRRSVVLAPEIIKYKSVFYLRRIPSRRLSCSINTRWSSNKRSWLKVWRNIFWGFSTRSSVSNPKALSSRSLWPLDFVALCRPAAQQLWDHAVGLVLGVQGPQVLLLQGALVPRHHHPERDRAVRSSFRLALHGERNCTKICASHFWLQM